MDATVKTKQEFFPGTLTRFSKEGDKCYFHCDNNTILCLQVVTDDIIRFRYTTVGHFDNDFSYAIDPNFSAGYSKMEIEELEKYVEIRTTTLICRINKEKLKTTILNYDGLVISEDEKGFHWEENYEYGGDIVQMSKVVQDSEHYFGLGDKPIQLNMRGKRLQMWGTDEYGYTKEMDPLYKNFPFYIGLHNQTAYGIFFDNTFRSFFDFASERRTVTSFWADGGEMNYYFIYGPNALSVSEKYTHLTGKPEMPPLWTLGYHQCKWSYYPEKKVKEITSKFRDLNIPCDAIYLDIDYMDGFRCFTWDKARFPDPKRMVDELKEQGFKTIVIIDPGIKIDEDYGVYKEAFEKGYFCKRADGPLMKGKVWPGECYFPDFTNPEVREWWAGLYKELIADIGIKGVWNDMNEPAVFEVPTKTFPNDVRHDFDGNPCSHRKAHNVYGMQMARATYEGVKKFSFPKRPFIITRSAYSGAQRYTSGWTGDNIATWEHLWIANIQCQRMAMCGMSFIGSDIGGFIEHPSSELYIRWIQLGIFHPFCRTHSSGDHGNQEPWSFSPETTDIVRKFIEMRYQLLPYLYTTFYQYIINGTPMLRPIAFVYQEDEDTHYRADEVLVGDHLLVCPVLEPNVQGRFMYLPKGDWYNYWTDELCKGGKEQWVTATLTEVPLFIRAGAVIPNYPVMQYVGEKEVEKLTLHVYYTEGEIVSKLYEDAGDGYEYKKGDHNHKKFKFSGKENEIYLVQDKSGNFKPSYSQCEIIIHGLPFEVTTLKINREEVSIDLINRTEKTIRFDVSEDFFELYLQA